MVRGETRKISATSRTVNKSGRLYKSNSSYLFFLGAGAGGLVIVAGSCDIDAPLSIIFDIENNLSSTYQSSTEGVKGENEQSKSIAGIKINKKMTEMKKI